MQTYVVLQDDPSLRKLTLEHLCDFKLDATERFLDHRSKGLDTTRPYNYFDMHEENGDYTTHSFSIDQFPGLSVQQAHDTIMNMYTSQGPDTRLDTRQVTPQDAPGSNNEPTGLFWYLVATPRYFFSRARVHRGQQPHQGTAAV